MNLLGLSKYYEVENFKSVNRIKEYQENNDYYFDYETKKDFINTFTKLRHVTEDQSQILNLLMRSKKVFEKIVFVTDNSFRNNFVFLNFTNNDTKYSLKNTETELGISDLNKDITFKDAFKEITRTNDFIFVYLCWNTENYEVNKNALVVLSSFKSLRIPDYMAKSKDAFLDEHTEDFRKLCETQQHKYKISSEVYLTNNQKSTKILKYMKDNDFVRIYNGYNNILRDLVKDQKFLSKLVFVTDLNYKSNYISFDMSKPDKYDSICEMKCDGLVINISINTTLFTNIVNKLIEDFEVIFVSFVDKDGHNIVGKN